VEALLLDSLYRWEDSILSLFPNGSEIMILTISLYVFVVVERNIVAGEIKTYTGIGRSF
jgi:hypothetical protein